jgi:exosortase
VLLCGLAALSAWAYWPTWEVMAHKWVHDPQYSHGYLVPLFALVLLWLRRDQAKSLAAQTNWWGVPLVLLGVAARIAGAYLYFDWLDAFSLLPCLAGLAVLLGGWPALRWAWPSIAFLVFMIPLPFRVETALAHPLQRVATIASTYVMQTIGLPAVDEGNTIILKEGRIGIVEACSGLSMMLIFFALSTAVAIVARRPWPDRIIVVLSAVPIAVASNVARITTTGLAQEWFGKEVAHKIFHDWAGWLMMPFAVALLGVELWVLSRLLVVIPERKPMSPFAAGQPAPAAPPSKGGRKRKKPSGPLLPSRSDRP